MFKYIRYLSIIVFKLFAKVFGLIWYFVAVRFRGYSRNVVYNYVLQNNIHLPRLYQRSPKLLINGFYELNNIRNTILFGKIKYRKISKLEYYFVLFVLWVWVDDDSNYDTYDGTYYEDRLYYGNAFDLGDTRAEYPMFDLKRSYLWTIRNTAYNFNYMFEEIAENDPNYFYIKFPKLGWHFGYIPYSNPTRKGRLVWFTEDYDKV